MTKPAKIIVMFVCNGCGHIQERAKGSGRFDCIACGEPVYRWSGSYDYVVWTPMVDLPPTLQ